MTSIIIAGRPNSEEMSECIIVAKNIYNMYPSSRFTIVLKSPKEWEKYCEDLCNLFGILKKTHPLILFSNGNKIGGAQEFFKLISDSFKYDKLIKKNNEYILDIDPSEITKLTRENTLLIEREYFCRTKGKTVLDKINDKLDTISIENFQNFYKKYNTIELDYSPEYIEDMKVYVKYNEKFTPEPKDYINYDDVMEQRPAYVDRDKYNEYHEELREKIELEKRLRREAEEEAKRKAEEELRQLKSQEDLNKKEEENNQTEESNTNKKKDKKKKKEEEEKKRKEEERKKKEEEERKKKEEEERKRKEEEERKKKEEEEKKKKEEEKTVTEESPQMKTESGKEEEKSNQQEIKEEKVIKYKRIYFKCYSDFDIPYDRYNKELIVETFKEENFQLILNPCFTFFGETLINNIKDYEAPLLPEREEPIIEEEEEEIPQTTIIPITETTQNQNPKDKNKKKEKEEQGNTNTSNANANQKNDKKFSPMNTATSNMSGKSTDKKNKEKEKDKEKEKENASLNQQIKAPLPQIKETEKFDCKIGGPTKSTELNTYKPNFAVEQNDLIIKDYGRLPSLRILDFDGDDFKFYQEYIPPYQQSEHIFNDTNLLNFGPETDILGKNLLMNIIQTINETDGYATYKVLPYNFTDWKKFSTNKVRILPNKCKDIKCVEYPLVEKLNQQISKYKRSLFEGNLKENEEEKNFELILHNDDFEQCFTLPEFFTLDIYKKNNIPHLIKTFSPGTFIYINLLYAINKMCELLEINNQTGYGFCLIVCKKFVFLAPLKEPYIYTKEIAENVDNKNIEKKEEIKENKTEENKTAEQNKEIKEIKEIKENVEKKEENTEKKDEKKKMGQRIPIFVEPYYFMGIYTLPYIESEWPESIKRKNVKFDLIEILKKSTN